MALLPNTFAPLSVNSVKTEHISNGAVKIGHPAGMTVFLKMLELAEI